MPYYQGPMPKTDEERTKMRAEALTQLRSMRDGWEQHTKTSRHGRDLLLPLFERDRYNECVHKLAIASGDVDPSYFETGEIKKNKKHGPPYDGIPVTWVLGKASRLLDRFDSEEGPPA